MHRAIASSSRGRATTPFRPRQRSRTTSHSAPTAFAPPGTGGRERSAWSTYPGPSGESRAWIMPWTSRRRSEEHTSELQSPCNLVCRLLLEKKKKELLEIILTAQQHVQPV